MLQIDDIRVLAAAIKKMIDKDRGSPLKKKMRQAMAYYKGRHDIHDYKLYYFDSNDQLQEEKYRSNTKISHGFFSELVDQKVQYLLSNPIEVHTQQEGLEELLNQYVNEDFQLILQELVEGASQKAFEYLFWRLDEAGRLSFRTADSLSIIPIYDGNYQLRQVIYYVDEELVIDGQAKQVAKVQFWTEDQVFYFVYDGKAIKLDESVAFNPSYHRLVKHTETGEVLGKGYGRLPFLVLENNRLKTSDLEPIKDLIDDYDLMACSLSNNLIDFDHPIYAVRGYQGDNLDKLTQNLKTRKTIGVGEGGGIDVKTVDIPIEARKEKLLIDKEAIYKFGMGFDSSQVGDGNVTNVVIKSRYSLLDLKCNKLEVRLKKVIKQMLELVVANINELHGKAYDPAELEIVLVRDVMANEMDNATIAKTEADTKQVAVQTVLDASSKLDQRTTLELLAEVLAIDPDEVEKALEEEGYVGDLVAEVDHEPVPEGDRTAPGFAGQADQQESL